MSLASFLPVLDQLRQRGAANSVAYDALADIVSRGRALGAAVAAREAGTATRIGVPFASVIELTDDIDAFVAANFGDLDFPPDLFVACRDTQAALFSLQLVRRLFADQAGPNAGAGDGGAPGVGPYVPYRLRQGETLERLAIKYLGDLERWPEIAAINGLVWPFLDTTRALLPADFTTAFTEGEFVVSPSADRGGVPAHVAVTGETILLPPDALVPGSGAATTARDVELFGRDWLLDDGQLAVNVDGEALTVEGMANMVQVVEAATQTLQGELLLHPDYGVALLLAVGVEGTKANVVMSALTMARAVARDPRITSVRGLQTTFQSITSDGTNRIAMRAHLIGAGERNLPLNLVVPDTLLVAGGTP